MMTTMTIITNFDLIMITRDKNDDEDNYVPMMTTTMT